MVIAYISDLHIEFIYRNHKMQGVDVSKWTPSTIADMFLRQLNYWDHLRKSAGRPGIDRVVVAGDVSHCPEDIIEFFTFLDQNTHIPIWYVLGNHDVWGWTSSFAPWMVVDNALPYHVMEARLAHHINSLKNVKLLRMGDMETVVDGDVTYRVIGDLGYTGCNLEFGAAQGVYRHALYDLEEDVNRTDQWSRFYDRCLCNLEPGEKLIVITHTPIEDWKGSHCPDESGNVYYINGHTHGYDGYRTTATYKDDAQNGYNKLDFTFGILDTHPMDIKENEDDVT